MMINCLWQFFVPQILANMYAQSLSYSVSQAPTYFLHLSTPLLKAKTRQMQIQLFPFLVAGRENLFRMKSALQANGIFPHGRYTRACAWMDKDSRKLRSSKGKNCKTMQFNWISTRGNSSSQSVFYFVAFVLHRGQVAWVRNQKFTAANCCAINCRLQPNPIPSLCFCFSWILIWSH